ncbi:ABC transporter substrate-binding protein [Sporichthya polymorpha]|uniref:ABC transporter substrate-binding protein n=1 Tax=Sporichthya polymorpha TaxID=35751 RepID=UPI00035D930B|nr:ABC transporter substrate-binding protein [Sporichthya polymorpha]
MYTRRSTLPRSSATRAGIGTLVLTLALSACGGTRQSDEAIEAAAGIRPVAADAPVPGVAADPAAGPVAAQPGAPAPANVATDSGPAAAGGPARPGTSTGADGTAKANTAKSGAAAAPGAGAPGVVTKKSLIKLGSVGTFSGPVGSLVKDTVTGIRIWAQAVNEKGGVNGHPISIQVGDDGGDPARFNSIVQQFVEKDGVLAFLFNTLAFAPNGNNKYLHSKKIFTYSETGSLELTYNDPYVLTPSPSGLSYADAMILAFGNGIGAKGGVKMAAYACSDFSLCDNFDKRWSDPNVLKKAGFELVARGRPSLTQPDYTSQCLAAKQNGATAILVALDGAAIRRFAGDCARQNYRPVLSSADLVITNDLLKDPNVDGLVVGGKMVPFPSMDAPGMKEAHAAFAKFAPGQIVTGGYAYGWLVGEFFAQTAKNLPDNPTYQDLEDGVYAIKNNDMKGMTYPITIRRGQVMDRQLCFGTTIIRGGKFVPAPGPALRCAKGGKPMSGPDDYDKIS